MIRIVLPWPPTVNTYYRRSNKGGVGRTYLTKRGKKYVDEVAVAVENARLDCQVPRETTGGRLRYTLTLFPPDKRKRDLSNYLKAPEDALTKAGVWEDDERVDLLTARRGPIVSKGRAVIEIEAM